jgi:formylglycine-generating enzyme required for sulfatase activity
MAETEITDYTDPATGLSFVLIRGGTFDMGDISKKDPYAVPAHRVSVGDFYLGRTEVTFAQFDLFCEATGREKPADEGWGRGDRPVINVTWFDAVDFTLWLSGQSGRTFRLPSESEWEYAARAGTVTPYWWGFQMTPNVANCADCGSIWDGKSTAPVGSFRPNPFGLMDMTGNVYEWCFDTFHEKYMGAPADGTPWLFGDTASHINRGGSWHQFSSEIRSSARSWNRSEQKLDDIGFRVLLEP